MLEIKKVLKGKRGMLLGILLVLAVVFYAVNLMPAVAATTFDVDGIGTGVKTSGFWINGVSYTGSNEKDAYLEFTFNGTAVSLLTILWTNRGFADVTIDGTSTPTQGSVYTPFDTFAPEVLSTHILLAEGLSPGNHTVRITVSGKHVVDSTDNYVVVDGFVYGQTTAEAAEYTQRVDDRDPTVNFVGSWGHGGTPMTSSNVAGNYAEFTFIGTAVDLIAVLWTNRGLADVTIDETSTPEQGQVNTPIDLYGANTEGNPVHDVRIPLASGLSPGEHTVRITVKGEHSKVSSENYVTVDAFEYKAFARKGGEKLTKMNSKIQENDPSFIWKGFWLSGESGSLSKGKQMVSNDAITPAQGEVTFNGTGVSLIHSTMEGGGSLGVVIDGFRYPEINMSSFPPKYQVVTPIARGLEMAEHKMTLTVKGGGYNVFVDGIVVEKGQVESKDKIISTELAQAIELPKEIRLFPEPQKIEWSNDDYFKIDQDTRIVVRDDAPAQDIFGAKILQKDLEKLGVGILICSESETKGGLVNSILVGEPETGNALSDFYKAKGISVTKENPGQEGYILKVCRDSIIVAGSDKAGTFYGIQTLRQLICKDNKEIFVPGVNIIDWPQFSFRGIQTGVKEKGQLNQEEIDSLMNILSRHKINNVLLCLNSRFPYKSHPECVDSLGQQLTREDLSRFADTARKYLIEIIPQMQGGIYCGWMMGGNPEISMDGNPSVWDPSNPNTHKIYLELCDEVIAAFKPKYIHIGFDEMVRGYDPKIRVEPFYKGLKNPGDKKAYEWFAEDITKIHDHLKNKGVGTMMWADVVVAPEADDYTTYTGMRGGPPDHFEKALPLLPKDIVMIPFFYSVCNNYPSMDRLRDAGFPVLGGPWHKVSTLFFSRYAANIPKVSSNGGKIMGIMNCMWEAGSIGWSMWFPQYVRSIADYIWKPINRFGDEPAIKKLIELSENDPLKDIPLGNFARSISLVNMGGGMLHARAGMFNYQENEQLDGLSVHPSGSHEDISWKITCTENGRFDKVVLKTWFRFGKIEEIAITRDYEDKYFVVAKDMDFSGSGNELDLTKWVRGSKLLKLRFMVSSPITVLDKFDLFGIVARNK